MIDAFHLKPGGYVEVPLNDSLKGLDSVVTVTFWAYGYPDFQPQDGTCFEAINPQETGS
jgi:hypothetical protein